MKILDLYITKVCNLDCEYCYVDVVKQEQTPFPTEDFIERINLLDYDVIKFFWWEPLIKWKEVQKIIHHVSQKKPSISFVIVTNGILLNQAKVTYISQTQNVEVLVSIHEWSYQKLKFNIDVLIQLKKQIWFYIIFSPDDFSNALWKLFFFVSKWFTQFSFAPEIYSNWDANNISRFQKLLSHLKSYILENNISISWSHMKSLKDMNYGCEKHVFTDEWKFSPCNRFKSLEKKQKFNYKEIYEYLDHTISYKSLPHRWFYTCPVWWYLDNEGAKLLESIGSYHKLNEVLLDFHRSVSQSIDFLTPDIQEIRFNMTQQCNLRCEYCYVDFTDDTLSFRTAKNIVDFFLSQSWTEKIFSFFWGEPLLEFATLEKIVLYINTQAQQLSKTVHYKIATNFMLVQDTIWAFLQEHHFEIHISFNGTESINQKMRDNSSLLVLKNIKKYLPQGLNEKFVVLLAFWPQEVWFLKQSMQYVYELWFRRVNLEMVFGESYKWSHKDIYAAVISVKYIVKRYTDIIIENISPKSLYLDIDTWGKCSENSLQFFWKDIDYKHKKLFDILLEKITYDTSDRKTEKIPQ